MEEEVGVLTVIAVTSLISVDGAIHRAAGPLLLQENQTHGGCRGGEAVESGGYRLPAKCEEREREDHIVTTFHFFSHSDVVSTVGPRGQYPEVLQSAYRSCLEKMLELELKTIVSCNSIIATVKS